MRKMTVHINDKEYRNTGIKSYDFNSEVEMIVDDYAFENTDLVDIKISKEVLLGEYVFKDCKNLKYVEFLEGCKNIKEGTFENCDIHTLTIPVSMYHINPAAFRNCHVDNIIYHGGYNKIKKMIKYLIDFKYENICVPNDKDYYKSINKQFNKDNKNKAKPNSLLYPRSDNTAFQIDSYGKLIMSTKLDQLVQNVEIFNMMIWNLMMNADNEDTIPMIKNKLNEIDFNWNLRFFVVPEKYKTLRANLILKGKSDKEVERDVLIMKLHDMVCITQDLIKQTQIELIKVGGK